MSTALFSTTSECEIVTTRTFNVSKELLFTAWSNPEYLKKWWGPNGFTNTFTEFDFREGGTWDFIMHGPEKGNYHNVCEFVKIDPTNLIAWKRHSQPLFKVLFTFEALSNAQTKVVFKMIFDTEEECNKLKKFVVDKNEENFDRLEEQLKRMT
ncbi:MAG TPA: SRPBCC family protein [Flavobacterium sp.]|uniref:SRPBCC family protein n=1 Tax=Flavobacterium sp. TaxID=239 RepID=UPI002CD389F8|nr:SRPBCC family protein [Flavobacterium sp.]HNP31964.1 SRPBCC family protein [Flavobacterium sp.]